MYVYDDAETEKESTDNSFKWYLVKKTDILFLLMYEGVLINP